eukprot:m.11295 g.11295  ORF g.11295 m.11295 type:complete len:169 (-) comp3963_c0_seq1:868-1374(-)
MPWGVSSVAWKSAAKMLYSIPVLITVNDLVGTITYAQGPSMQPTLNPDPGSNDWVLIDKWSTRHRKLQRGDVIALWSPSERRTLLVKRVLAVPEDVVRRRGYQHSYVSVPRGHCWVEGDNEKASMDSNLFGAVPAALVVGRVTAVVWPPSRWGRVKQQPISSRVTVPR